MSKYKIFYLNGAGVLQSV